MPHETSEKILQAAFTVLSREGYENTSIKQIAEEAGVAQGLVHYYFKSKQLLVLAVLKYVCQEVQLEAVHGTAGALAALEDTKRKFHDSQNANSLLVELIGVGLHDAQLGAGVREFIRDQRSNVEGIARQVFAEREQDASQAPAIAGAVWGAIVGIMIQRLIDPGFDADGAIDALTQMSLTAVFPSASGA